jgi:hypothetical protein
MVGPDRPLWVDGIRNPALSDDEYNEATAFLQAQNLQALWQSATDHQEAQISGAAYGLVTLGVMQQKPRALAVMGWINAVWALYYARKPLVTHEWDSVLMDFSGCGPMPCSVPELKAEVMA